jgi:hypothetical protein
MVSDSWIAVHDNLPPNSSESDMTNLSDTDRIRLLGVTCDSKLNTWRSYDLAKQSRFLILDARTLIISESMSNWNC